MNEELTIGDLPQPEYEGTVSINDLDVDGENPNEQNEEIFSLLCEKLRTNGWLGGPIITDTDGLIADGEHRWRAAQEIGLDGIPVRQYDIDDPTRRLWRQELNKIAGTHDAKRDALEYDYLLSNGKADEIQALTNAAGEDLDELLAEIKLNGEQHVPYEYETEHNVYFEDCVDGMRERVEDNSIDCVLTDPPYGFKYAGETKGGNFEELKNVDNWDLFQDALAEMRRVLVKDGHIYWWWGWQHYGRMETMFRDVFDHVDTLIWVKDVFGLNGSRASYRPQYEVCFHGVVSDSPRMLNDHELLSDVLEHAKDHTGGYEHPTQKPVSLMADLITDATDPGDTVLDGFLGSGATAVAAILNRRECIGFELDEENYRSVIERRISETKRQVESETNQEANADN
jgi:DNA modification methylase